MVKSKKGMGWGKASASIQKKEGVSKKSADAMLAAGARKASPAAKKANPNLNKVKGKPKTENSVTRSAHVKGKKGTAHIARMAKHAHKAIDNLHSLLNEHS